MKVSVVIPVFNAKKYIERAVASALSQPEVAEVILVEDGSADASLSVCRSLSESNNKVIVLTHSGNKNKGAAASRNAGIKKASSEFIAFLDADDYYLLQRFQTTLQCFSADDSVDGVYEAIGFFTNSNDVHLFSNISPVPAEKLFENLNPVGNKVWFSGNGLTVKKTIFDKSGYYDESLRTSEDTLLWFKMAATAKLVAGNIKTAVAVTERVSDSLSADKRLARKDLAGMLLKLYKWSSHKGMDDSKKELILDALFFRVFNFSAKHTIEKLATEAHFIFRVFSVDPAYAIRNSMAFRRYAGQLAGYNRILQFLKHSSS